MNKIIKLTAILAAIAFLAALARKDFTSLLKKIFPYEYKLEILAAAWEYNLDPLFVAAVIRAESSFNENASSKVAHGLMQLTDETADFISGRTNLKYADRKTPLVNIRMGCYYLAYLRGRFGDMQTALAAYNAGPGNVSRWLSDKRYSKDGRTLFAVPFRQTEKYLKRIKIYYKMYKFLYG